MGLLDHNVITLEKIPSIYRRARSASLGVMRFLFVAFCLFNPDGFEAGTLGRELLAIKRLPDRVGLSKSFFAICDNGNVGVVRLLCGVGSGIGPAPFLM